MFKPLQSHINEHYVDGVGSIHPRTQILWKTASFLALRKATTANQRIVSAKMFKKAVEELKQQNQTVFYAIATGILAEMAWHAQMGNIPEESEQIICDLKQTYSLFCQKALSEGTINPFDDGFIKLDSKAISDNPDKLWETSTLIGY